MSPRRPGGVTLVCTLAMLAALFQLITAQYGFWNPDELNTLQWIEVHFVAARVELGVTYLYATITLLSCYYICRARNWARWTYLVVTALHYAAAFVLLGMEDAEGNFRFARFRGSMLPGLLLYLAAIFVLFTPAAREYFAAGNRPWWRIEEEEEEEGKK